LKATGNGQRTGGKSGGDAWNLPRWLVMVEGLVVKRPRRGAAKVGNKMGQERGVLREKGEEWKRRGHRLHHIHKPEA